MLYDKEDNFIERQAGKTITKGSIMKLNNNKFKGKEPSIPSKFSTMFIETDTQKGFGSSSNRFNDILNHSEAIPGPGSYSIYQDSITENDSIIFSKKGFGNFASDNKKLKTSVYINTGPGPGYYNSKIKNINPPNNIKKRQIFNDSKQFNNSKKMWEKIKKDKIIVKKSWGPGAYNVKIKHNIKNSAYVFKNSERKKILANSLNDNNYNIAKDLIIKDKFNKKGNLLGMFKKTSLKKPIKNEIRQNLEQIKEVIVLKNNKQKIGPGAYKLQESYNFQINQKHDNKKGYRNFLNGYQDRFGNLCPPFNLDLFISPGPGKYDIKTDNITNKTIKRPFLDKISKNNFFNINKKEVSEFIYNNEPLPNKISFHLNMKNKWI